MSLFIKICGLKDAKHVQMAIEAGANAVGFVFADSVRRVTPQQAASACNDIPNHIKRVAVMQHPTNEEWLNVLDEFHPDVLQTDFGDYEYLDVPDSVERWPVHREGGAKPATRDTYIYEGKKSGRGETVDWSLAATLAGDGRMILAGGISAHNVADAVALVRPYGVDVSSAVESSPGQKDYELIKEFVNAARAAENQL